LTNNKTKKTLLADGPVTTSALQWRFSLTIPITLVGRVSKLNVQIACRLSRLNT